MSQSYNKINEFVFEMKLAIKFELKFYGFGWWDISNNYYRKKKRLRNYFLIALAGVFVVWLHGGVGMLFWH